MSSKNPPILVSQNSSDINARDRLSFWARRNRMQKSLILSVIGHIILILLIVIGQPSFNRKIEDLGTPIEVSFVDIPQKASKQEKANPKPPVPIPPTAPTPEPKETLPEPPIPQKAPPPPPVEEAEIIPLNKPEKPIEKPKEKPPEPPKIVDKVVSKKPVDEKPKPDFASSLKNLQKELNPTVSEKPEKPEKPQVTESLADQVNKALATTAPISQQKNLDQMSQGLKEDELAKVRDQLIACWNPPTGAKGLHEMKVEVEIEVATNKTVTNARITNKSPRTSKPFEESALRAVFVCGPLELPDEKYHIWKNITIGFNPKDIF